MFACIVTPFLDIKVLNYTNRKGENRLGRESSAVGFMVVENSLVL